MINPYIISIFAPLAGFLITGAFGYVFGKRIANLVTCGLMAIALGASLLVFQDVIFGGHNHHFYLKQVMMDKNSFSFLEYPAPLL